MFYNAQNSWKLMEVDFMSFSLVILIYSAYGFDAKHSYAVCFYSSEFSVFFKQLSMLDVAWYVMHRVLDLRFRCWKIDSTFMWWSWTCASVTKQYNLALIFHILWFNVISPQSLLWSDASTFGTIEHLIQSESSFDFLYRKRLSLPYLITNSSLSCAFFFLLG